jgi:hypothetical protein
MPFGCATDVHNTFVVVIFDNLVVVIRVTVNLIRREIQNKYGDARQLLISRNPTTKKGDMHTEQALVILRKRGKKETCIYITMLI